MFNLIIFFSLLALGLVVGRIGEAMHYRRLEDGEDKLAHILIFSDRNLPAGVTWEKAQFVSGSAVMSNDYFSALVAGLRKLFGGRIGLYVNLIERARREAVLRIKQAAEWQGAGVVINVKFTTTSLGRQGGVTAVEVLAFGTALREAKSDR